MWESCCVSTSRPLRRWTPEERSAELQASAVKATLCLWVLADEAAFKLCSPSAPVMTSVKNGKIEQCTLWCHGKGKSVEPTRSCSHTWKVRLGTQCDRLSINCSFEGKHVSSMEVNWRNTLPCLIVFRRSCHLQLCFCTREGRQFAICLATPTRDPCFVWGPLFAYMPVPSC